MGHWWLPFQHWLAVHTGTVNETGPYYGFFSGFGSDLGEVTLLGGLIAIYRRHNCHTRWCFRLAHHDLADPGTGLVHRLCRTHHPDHPGRPLTARHITLIHQRRGGGDVREG
jgi:hypothetical protein